MATPQPQKNIVKKKTKQKDKIVNIDHKKKITEKDITFSLDDVIALGGEKVANSFTIA